MNFLLGHLKLILKWDDSGIDGTFRYLNKVWKFIQEYKDKLIEPSKELIKLRHKMIYEITNRLESLTMNTVISGFMEFTNKIIAEAKKLNGVDRRNFRNYCYFIISFYTSPFRRIMAKLRKYRKCI